MRLTRRDAIVALSAVGVAVGGVGALEWTERRSGDSNIGSAELRTLIGVGEVLYPSELGGIDRFVERYIRGRAEKEDTEGIAEAVAYLDAYAVAWHDERFTELDERTQESVLRSMGADTATPDPAGSDAERVRYYVVNELLFALYSTPTGGKLVGIENPPGHPGGRESYQRGPNG